MRARVMTPLLVCPVAEKELPPEPFDPDRALDPVVRCWICHTPLERIYVDENGERVA